MARMQTILLGKITKINGFEGAVTVRTDRNFSDKLPPIESVFLEIEGRPVPFFVEHLEEFNDGSIRLIFKDYNSYEKIKEFAGCNVLLPLKDKEQPVNSNSEDLTGFSLFSENDLYIGSVTRIIKNPGQWLLQVCGSNGNEILVPLHEDLIVEIDKERKKIFLTIPDGLLDLNT